MQPKEPESPLSHGIDALISHLTPVDGAGYYVFDHDDIRKIFFCGAYQALVLAIDGFSRGPKEVQVEISEMLAKCCAELDIVNS
jgi:hypothetical protein